MYTIIKKSKNVIVKKIKINDKEFIVKEYFHYCKNLLIEINILSTIDHPNIIKLVDFDYSIKKIILPFEQNCLLNIIQNSKINIVDKINILIQLAETIHFLHQKNILHLDLKLDNIMLSNGNIKLIDFGSSEYLFNEFITTNEKKCTPTHRPPDFFNQSITEKSKIAKSFDVWSFGIIMIEIFTNVPMYLQEKMPKYFKNTNIESFDKEVHNFILSDNFTELKNSLPKKLRQCLELDPSARCNFSEIICYLKKINKIMSCKLMYFSLSKKYTTSCGKQFFNCHTKWTLYYDYIINILPRNIFLPNIVICSTKNYICNMEKRNIFINKYIINQIILWSSIITTPQNYHLLEIILSQKICYQTIDYIIITWGPIFYY